MESGAQRAGDDPLAIFLQTGLSLHITPVGELAQIYTAIGLSAEETTMTLASVRGTRRPEEEDMTGVNQRCIAEINDNLQEKMTRDNIKPLSDIVRNLPSPYKRLQTYFDGCHKDNCAHCDFATKLNLPKPKTVNE